VAKSSTRLKFSSGGLRVGFVRLIDAAPLILAQELGYFAREGLAVSLERQIGWGNVRDKLTFGQLHASHALLGMPPLSVLGREQFVEPLVAILALGSGGNAITLSRRLIAMGIRTEEALARQVRRREGRPLVFAHVFSCSTHHYLLRDWLANAGINPDEQVRLCVQPPPQMPPQMAEGFLDGYCVGEPWNSMAEHEGHGAPVAATTRRAPGHPEKVLAVGRDWLASHPDEAQSLVRALLRACAFCEDAANAGTIARILSSPRYLDVTEAVLHRSLTELSPGFRSWAPHTTIPRPEHAAWLL
jgi:ABC-type nitrate/sulfonate/bicarbonate transport system substrate-binding protein